MTRGGHGMSQGSILGEDPVIVLCQRPDWVTHGHECLLGKLIGQKGVLCDTLL